MQTTQQERKRKYYLLLPILLIPCITLLFYALAGGKGNTTAIVKNKGLNPALPQAQLNTETEDKMTLYSMALKDSLGRGELRKSDPYSQPPSQSDSFSNIAMTASNGRFGFHYVDSNEMKIKDRLATLQHTLDQPSNYSSHYNTNESAENEQLKIQLQQLHEQIRQLSSNQQNTTDPQMEQINTVLNKIIDVQHPQEVKDRLESENLKNKGPLYSISENKEHIVASPINHVQSIQTVGFYGITDKEDTINYKGTAINAQVQETQTLTSGATIKIRLASDIIVAGQSLPKGSFVYGICTISGERMKVVVSSIRDGDRLLPVSMIGYDMDGQEGIRIPGAISREAVKDGMDQGIQSMNLMALDPGIGAQAAGAALQTAKGLFSKKVKLIKATIRADYPLLLVNK